MPLCEELPDLFLLPNRGLEEGRATTPLLPVQVGIPEIEHDIDIKSCFHAQCH